MYQGFDSSDTGVEVERPGSISHHITPLELGGTDEYRNLVIVHKDIHLLFHATNAELIATLKAKLNLDQKQLDRVNKFRLKAGRAKI